MPSSEKHIMFPLQINNRPLIGDRSASSVLRCLEQFVQIYGVSFVLDIYLPFVIKTVNSIIACLLRGNNSNNNNATTTTDNNNSSNSNNNSTTNCSTADLTENFNQISISTLPVVWNYRTLARLIAALMLFYQIIMYLPDSELVEQLQESVLQDVLIKAVRISGRFDISFPGGVVGRRAVLYKFIDVVFVIGLRVGFELARTQLTSIFQVFFALFDRVINTTVTKNILSNNNYQVKEDTSTTTTTTNATTSGIVDTKVSQVSSNDTNSSQTSSLNCIMAELVETFDCDLARLAYISFCHLAGKRNFR
ncbi:unnamed protein product [Trichobilharzia regenti]|nr:unnamed protein product [Trichobilharzia regenti]